MQIHETRQDDVLVVGVQGRLESAYSAEFETRLLKLIDGGERRMCIDCGELTYLNSTALRAFLVVAKRMGAVGGKMVISDLCAQTRKVFEVIGFTKIMTLVSTREEGLQHLAGATAVS
jgi:anti-sigma B factor antagonist